MVAVTELFSIAINYTRVLVVTELVAHRTQYSFILNQIYVFFDLKIKLPCVMLRSISTHFTHREQLLTPLQLTSTLGKVDIEATYTGPTGGASLAGALRLGMSRALTSFVDKNVREQLRLGKLQCTSAGLLSSRKDSSRGKIIYFI